jgi:hypothetical protein
MPMRGLPGTRPTLPHRLPLLQPAQVLKQTHATEPASDGSGPGAKRLKGWRFANMSQWSPGSLPLRPLHGKKHRFAHRSEL